MRLQIKGLRTYFKLNRNITVKSVDGVDLSVFSGERVGIVGESGAGKTVLAHSILRLISPPGRIESGQILWGGRNLLTLSEEDMRKTRGRHIAMIFQHPQSSLNPVFSIGKQLVDVIRLHHKLDKREAKEKAISYLDLVHLPDAEVRFDDYPHQFSGGMAQRICIAMALVCRPSLLIADEPSSSLDVTVQSQIIELLNELNHSLGMGILFISHDLGVVAQLADRVAVMYKGRILEIGKSEDVYKHPQHPYTKTLLNSVPIPDPTLKPNRKGLFSDFKLSANTQNGCPFRLRCPDQIAICETKNPQLMDTENRAQMAACWKKQI